MKARMRARLAAVMAALFAMPACGLGEGRRYGGSRADELREIVGAPGGWLAVGTTASSDGDLAMRTRETRTGWAVFIGEDGTPLWSVCTGRESMAHMRAPVVLDGGGFSFVLTDEDGQRGQWLVLDGHGEIVSRVDVAGPDALTGDGVRRTIAAMTPVQTEDGLRLLTVLADDAGALSLVMMDEKGSVTAHEQLMGAADGMLAANAHGEYAWISAKDGQIEIHRMTGDGQFVMAQGISLGDAVERVSDVLMQDDGSVTIAVKKEIGGAVVRASTSGDVLFVYGMQRTPEHICQTRTGFAVYVGGSVIFLDEDGALIQTQTGLPEGALDIVGMADGAALLLREGKASEHEAMLYAVTQSTFAAMGTPEPERPKPAAAPNTEMDAEGAHIHCEDVPGGVCVTYVNAAGERVFETKIPIHTAADVLVWRCALPLEDGGVALGGCYVYGTGDEAHSTGAVALLDGRGVLRRIEELTEIGCVLKIEAGDGAALWLEIAKQKFKDAPADGQMTFGL